MQNNKLRASAVAGLLLVPLLIGLFLTGGAGAITPPTLDETSWTKGTIDSDSDLSNEMSEAIDLNGHLHVSYYDSIGRNLIYATNSGGNWRTEVVDSTWEVGKYNSIDVDSSGKVHISYFDNLNQDLLYATGNYGSWTLTSVDSTGVVGEYNTLVCASDVVHIIYLDYTNDALKHAVGSESGWTVNTVMNDVDSVGGMITYEGELHAVYMSLDDKLKYAKMNGTVWSSENIEGPVSIGLGMDIEVFAGTVYVAYTVVGELKVAIRSTSGVWSNQVIDDSSTISSWLSMSSDLLGRVHISYYDSPNQDLRYAVKSGTEWSFSVLDTSGGICSAMVSDYNGKQHIVYIDLVQANTPLSYITNSGAKWITETVDQGGKVGEHSSIVVDAGGHTHIVYYDQTHGCLNYANNMDGWATEVVDNFTPAVGLYPSLAMDATGHLHVSYYDSTNQDLKYANNVEGNWTIETMDSPGSVGMHSSIVVDGEGAIHIVYVSQGSSNLKYTGNTGGDWTVSLIDNSGAVEGMMSAAVDSMNRVHAVYYRGGELIHTNQTGSAWASESLESTDQLGGGVSMYIDSEDQIFVTYYNVVLSMLKYINNVDGQWNPATVIEAEGAVGVGNVIMVDEDGDEHIAYVDAAGDGTLKFAEKRNGIWMFQKVDLQGCGEHISMAMDGLGRIHISYFDPVGDNLMYASAITIPSTPMNLTASVSDGTVTLHWEAPANNGGANITQYAIYRGSGEDGLTLYTTVSGSITNYIDTGLENGVTLVYRIRAVNSEGSSPYSNTVEATPCSPPGAPDVKASGRDKAVQLSWDEPDNGGAEILEYRIYRKNETGVFHYIATVDGTETSYKDVDLENGVEYFYYVTAVNPAGESTPSATASATANPDSTWMIIVVVIVVVAAIGVGAFLFLRQKGKF